MSGNEGNRLARLAKVYVLPEGEIPVALLTFDLGVEAGQLIIVAGGLVALAMIHRYAQSRFRTVQVCTAYAIGSVVALWMIQRGVA